MSKWTRFRDRFVASLINWLGIGDALRDAGLDDEYMDPSTPDNLSGGGSPVEPPVSLDLRPWDKCVLSSNWKGTNAAHRMMNVLSPKMPEATFRDYVGWMLGQGADTAHVFLINEGDGECSGYSPWGVGIGPGPGEPNQTVVQLMNGRIDYMLAHGLAVVVWLISDDSSDWATALAKDATLCLRWIADDGLLGAASTVVLGLEMDEYWDSAQAKAVAKATRAVYAGKIGVHHTGGKATFVSLGDILFYQVDPGRSAAQIKADTAAALKYGKPVNFFELDRGPNRALAQAALDAGAFGVGNCAPGVAPKGGAAPQQSADPAPAATADASLDFRHGGVRANPAEDPRCRISGLKVGTDSLSFKWESGIPADWKRGSTAKGPMVLACAFYDEGGTWVGGKFDWIDEARTTRDFKNIREGYNGWNAAAFFAAKKRAFCVASADGKFRSNIIEA